MPLNNPPVLTAHLFPELLEHLLDALDRLDDTDWDLPTVCQGWTVKDVALHLWGGDIGILSRRRDGFITGPGITAWEELVDYINQLNTEWVQVTRRLSPRLLRDQLAFTGPQVSNLICRLDPRAIGAQVSWAGPDPAPVWLDIAREYTERWLHQQHIREAAGLPLLTRQRFLEPVLAAFMHAMPRAYLGVAAPQGTTVRLTIEGPSGGTWFIQRAEDRWILNAGIPPAASAAHIRMSEDLAWRLFTRGVHPESAQEKMQIDGDPLLGRAVLNMVAIIA